MKHAGILYPHEELLGFWALKHFEALQNRKWGVYKINKSAKHTFVCKYSGNLIEIISLGKYTWITSGKSLREAMCGEI